MKKEIITKVEVLSTGELLLVLESGGKPDYQYIYREAAGVYWDETLHGFKSTELKEWSCSKWYSHIVSIVKSGLGVDLQLSNHVSWGNVLKKDKEEIIELDN